MTRTRHSPELVDRILIGLCALIWLVLLGMSVAAAVALVDLGRGFHKPAQNPHTGLLYIIIGVSALIILAAIPVLLRARPATSARLGPSLPGFKPMRGDAPAVPPGRPAPAPGFGAPAAQRRRVSGHPVRPDRDAINRVLLRGIVEISAVLGTALTAVALATYLMAVGKDGAAWAGYGVAGFITAAMPVVPWWHLRQLRGLLAGPGRSG